MAEGTIFKFHNDLDTDQIIASQYLLLPNLEEMKEHTFESLDPDFPKKVKPGDFVVGGENFGCGSSREHAPIAILGAGMKAVIAHSFARIFYRNAFNMGLLLLEIGDDVNKIKDGDKLEVSPEEGVIKNLTTGETIKVPALSPVMQNLIDKGGLVNYVREEIEAEGK